MTPDPKSIVLDVDGVLLDCEAGFAKVARLHFEQELPRLNNSYDLGKRYGLTSDQAQEVWQAMEEHEHGWRGFDVMPRAREAFFRLRAQGYNLHLVTAISEDLRGLRDECLIKHGMVPDSLHCTGSFHGPKADIIRGLNPIMVVEDRLSNLDDIPFVPNRVFVDHGDEQLGFVVHEDIIQVKSLWQWVNQWELSQNLAKRPRLASVNASPAPRV